MTKHEEELLAIKREAAQYFERYAIVTEQKEQLEQELRELRALHERQLAHLHRRVRLLSQER